MIFIVVDNFRKIFENTKNITDNNDEPLSILDLIAMLLSFISVGLFAYEQFVKISIEQARILLVIDYIICFIFFVDFIVDFIEAKDKIKYMKTAWIDVLASIPVIDIFGSNRVIKILRLLRILKAISSIRTLLLHSVKDKASSMVILAITICFGVIVFSSLSILYFETNINSNIKTAGDAIWWTFSTITTVGYGDRFPVTPEGRIIGIFTMVVGISVFSIVTAYIASKFSILNNEDNGKKNN